MTKKSLADDLRKKLGQSRADMNADKAKKIKQAMMLGSNNSYKKKVEKTQNLGFAALEKEMQLENLIKGEEKAREEMELGNLMKKIQLEKDKAACLHNSVTERDLDADIINERRSSEQEAAEIKEEVAHQVQLKRGKMKKLLEMMRAKANLRKAALEAELNALRNKMAQEMLAAHKNGNLDTCRKGKTNVDHREAYCNLHLVDDFMRNADCKTDENFCYMCCEIEYGNMFIDKREGCYNMCDIKIPKKATVGPPPGDGPWLWTPKAEAK